MLENILLNYVVFLLKIITVVISLIILLAATIKLKKDGKENDNGVIKITDISEKILNQKEELEESMMDEEELKKKKKQKETKTKNDTISKRLFILEFNGDIQASGTKSLREEITAIINIAKPEDEVLLKLESPGGLVHSYGLAASQLQRLRDNGIYLTIAVDKVAASGGYMMACVGNQIIAAPFSFIGSIGVIAESVNIHKLLKKHDVDVDVITAGKYKRTLTLIGENTEEGRKKFQEELSEIHMLFKNFVSKNRPELDIDNIATGETWLGEKALELKLVDQIITSDDFILKAVKDRKVYLIKYKEKRSLTEKIGIQFETSIQNIINKILEKSTNIK